MAKGFKHGGGGADLLNFKVVGNPQPEVAKENTIWIDTDAPITGWIFSLTEPAQPQEGMVWITTGASSTVEFNALKKNGIQVYPLSAKQCIGGAWVDKTAKSYQGGAWVDWIDESLLYRYGDENIELTGGWITGTPIVFDANFEVPGNLNITRNEDGITASQTVGYGNNCLYISTLIDLTDYKTLYFNGSMSSSRYDYGFFGIWSEFGHAQNDNVLAKLTPNLSMGVHSIDVSGINQKCRIGFYLFNTGFCVNMLEMWLE